MLSQAAIRDATSREGQSERLQTARELAREGFDHVTTEDSLLTALRRLGSRDVNTLPVVGLDGSGRLEGIVSHQDLLAAYERFLTIEPH